jgi:hypothetical protein
MIVLPGHVGRQAGNGSRVLEEPPGQRRLAVVLLRLCFHNFQENLNAGSFRPGRGLIKHNGAAVDGALKCHGVFRFDLVLFYQMRADRSTTGRRRLKEMIHEVK